ncbi:hypothetical protein CSA17_04335 [bacterium DOLJORAL78_65_58]|nr:MAG: hypothetical protein CSA17_04335 [bacterium DOLJORAL78_65_58]
MEGTQSFIIHENPCSHCFSSGACHQGLRNCIPTPRFAPWIRSGQSPHHLGRGSRIMKKITLAILLATLLCAAFATAQPYENSSVVGQVQDRVVITVKSGVKMNLDKSGDGVLVGVPGLDALSKRFSVRDMEQLYAGMTDNLKSKSIADKALRVWAVDFPQEMGLKNVQAAYQALDEVEEVRLVDICKMYDAYLPNDIHNSQWYLRNSQVAGGDIRAVGGWNNAMGDSNIIVAVIDSGVDWNHPDLGGTHPDKVNGAIWTNWDEYYGTPGVDDDGNGKIDDIRGWDFVNLPASQGWPDEDVTTQDNDPSDYESHGTACAGCVAALTNNGLGIAGTAPGCKIMALRVGWLPNGSTQGVVRMDFAAQGILYAANNGASIINASWGSSSYLSFSVSSAIAEGILICTAAGNDNSSEDPSYLSTYPGVLAVAATASNDGKSSFSNYGSWVEISAPGTNIYTTYWNQSTMSHTYTFIDGTSFASPITAGAAALIWSANPGLGYLQISRILTDNADNIDDINPNYAGQLGTGRVNLLRALGDTENRYPEEFPTVFDALNCATDGFTVALEGGVSVDGPVVIPNREIQVLGGYSSDYGSRDPEGNPTLITASNNNTGLKFQSGTSSSTVVDGFRISGGGGLQYSGIPYDGYYGGGVQLNNVSPTLRHLDITGNSVGSTSSLGCGGGMMLNGSNAVLENIHIHGNTGIYGGGMIIYNSDITMTDCVVENNTLQTGNLSFAPQGGGIHVAASTLTLNNCVIDGHSDCDLGGGLFATDGSVITSNGGSITNNSAKTGGAGVHMTGGSLALNRTEIRDNTKLATSTFMNGGGLYISGADVVADSITVSDNTADLGGGAVFKDCPDVAVSNSVFQGNTGTFFAGAMIFDNVTNGSITGNTVVENEGTLSGGGGLQVNGPVPEISNNIFAFNSGTGSMANGVNVPAEPAVFTCNDVYSNGTDFGGMADPTGTNGNISADPLFCDLAGGDLGISDDSPCAPAHLDDCELIGAMAAGCGGASPVPDEESGIPVAFRVEQNYPNPFNPSTKIRFALPAQGMTEVAIYNVAGQRVKTLVKEVLPAQIHEVVWTGRDDAERSVAAGVYFYRVTSGSNTSVGRMALIK